MFSEKKMGETVQIKIEKASSDGKGLARTAEGVFFVEGALPGETVEAEIVQRKKDFAIARTVRVIEANPGRVTPRCPWFCKCGGCQLQHASYPLQLEIKSEIIGDALRRIGGFELPAVECMPSPQQFGYRNKAAFPIRKIKGRPVPGFYEAGSHRVVQLESCPVNAAPLEALFAVLRTELSKLDLSVYDERAHLGAMRHLILRAGLHTGETLVSLVVNGRLNAHSVHSIAGLSRSLKGLSTLTLNHNSRPGNVILGERSEALTGSGLIHERLNDWTLTFDTSSFFQINSDQAEALYHYVGALAEGQRVLELYSGVGALTCYLAQGRSVTAVEEWRSAVDLMKDNMTYNGFQNVEALSGRAEDVISAMNQETDKYDLVVLDPPRTGCDRSVLEKIISLNVPRVIYVSCNPPTLARDAKLLAAGGYRLESVKAFDMFPQTVHVETVVLMSRVLK